MYPRKQHLYPGGQMSRSSRYRWPATGPSAHLENQESSSSSDSSESEGIGVDGEDENEIYHSVSPGPVRTEMIRNAGFPEQLLSKVPILEPKDVSDAIIYALSTPRHVQVNELRITPLDETIQEAKPR